MRLLVFLVLAITLISLSAGCRAVSSVWERATVVRNPVSQSQPYEPALAERSSTLSEPAVAPKPLVQTVALEVEVNTEPSRPTLAAPKAALDPTPAASNGTVEEAANEPATSTETPAESETAEPFDFLPPEPPLSTTPVRSGVTLEEVIQSVYSTYPLLQASITQRQRAAGQHLSTWGAFDLNAKASTENKALGFYENYRHKFGLSRNIYDNGGQWTSQYSLGRGEFEPWYGEREKQEGGEFQLGLIKPLQQGRDIDARRAAIWRATYERQRVEPAIQADLIAFVFDGSAAYWDWVAAGQRYELAKSLLGIAELRNSQIARRVELGDLPKPAETENARLVVKRKGALLDAQRKLQQASAKLSLFYRDEYGNPLSVNDSQLPVVEFGIVEVPMPGADLDTALASRPELFEINAKRSQLQVSLSEARNNMLPRLDAYATAAQDVGGKASSKDDKQDLDFEAGFYFDVPIERRNAQGRIVEVQAQLAQLAAQSRMVQDRILVDLQAAAAAIEGAKGRVEAARESIELAKELVRVEQRRFQTGDASLLEVTLREQQLFESTEDLISATFDLNVAQAAYRAALGIDRL